MGLTGRPGERSLACRWRVAVVFCQTEESRMKTLFPLFAAGFITRAVVDSLRVKIPAQMTF